jgi:hypothetical protein
MLQPLTHSPRTLTLAAAAAGVAPTALRVNPFMGGNLVSAAGAANALLVGASVNRFTALKYAKIVVAAADITAAAGVIGQTAGAREADGDVSGDLLLTFGTAAGQIIDSIPDHTDATDADTHLGLIVVVNGVPYKRIVDANAPNPAAGEFCMDDNTNDNFNLSIGASTGASVLKVGTEIEVFIGLNIGKCAERDASGVLIAGTALAASIPEERVLGVISTYTDTAGRSVTGLVKSDFVMAEAAAMSLVGVTL